MQEYLSFRKMITPVIIQVLFWIGVVLSVIGALVTMFGQSFLYGLVMLIVGPLMVRIYCELLIVAFKINDALQDIRRHHLGEPAEPPSAPL